MAVTREALYEQVWAAPMLKVAAEYRVSSSFLARVCTNLNVPRPPRGYWAKKAVGKAAPKPPLPEPHPDHALEWARDGESVPRAPRPLPQAPAPRRRRRTPPEVDTSVHPLLRNVREAFEQGRPNAVGHLRPRKFLLPDLFVTKELLPRALELANEFFQLFEHEGSTVVLASGDDEQHRPALDYREKSGAYEIGSWETWRPARPTVVFVGTVAIGLTLYELSEHVEVRSVHNGYERLDRLPDPKRAAIRRRQWIHERDMPSGRLALRAYSPYSGTDWQQVWREASAGELSGKGATIERGLRRAAPTIAEQVATARAKADAEYAKRQAEWRAYEQREAERKRHEQEQRRIELRRCSREELLAIVDRWSQARAVDAFFTDAASSADTAAPEQQAHLLERLQRARALIGDLNPLGRFLAWKAPEERET